MEWWLYLVYEFSNFLLIIFGIWLSFEGVAKAVEKNKVYKRTLAVFCFLLGGIGMYFDAVARHASDKTSTTLIRDVEDTLGRTNDLLGKLEIVATNTGVLLKFATVAEPQIRVLQAQVGDLRKEFAATGKHDPKLEDELAAKTRELQALTQVPVLAEHLRSWQEMDERRRLAVSSKIDSEYSRYRQDHPGDEQGLAEISKKLPIETRKAAEQSADDLKAIFADADSVRKVLLQMIPAQQQTPSDRAMERQFAQTQHDLTGANPRLAAAYIEELAARVRVPK
jgi:hypothetical protein